MATSDPTEIEFASEGEQLAALLYLPEGDGPHACVVMAGGWCYVKELVQPKFARVFTEHGLAALIFDYRCMGASSGDPRQHIDPWAQIEDYRNAISFVERLDAIDGDRIAAWGISYSGGHVLILGAIDPRVRVACGVVPVIDGYENMRLAHGTLGLRRLKAALLEARRKLHATGEQTYLPHQPADDTELATWPYPQSRLTFSRLKETQAPAYEGRSTAQSTELLMSYSVMPFLKRLTGTPTLMIVAEGDDHTHWELATDAYAAIPGPQKRFEIVRRSTHLTFYEDDDTVRSVAAIAAGWFTEHLGA
ncbi:MAG: alpha/beta hydrolase [Solirubrobacterales bacterium]